MFIVAICTNEALCSFPMSFTEPNMFVYVLLFSFLFFLFLMSLVLEQHDSMLPGWWIITEQELSIIFVQSSHGLVHITSTSS